ncbi:MAG: sulfate reduction electron transfer complex DsrMKJOP subunit DsrJ [Chloroflexota bacterium]
MYDGVKIITGIVVFLVLLSFPVWYVAATGQASYAPQLKVAADEKQCVEPTEYMRESHMTLLSDWREKVVREGIRTHVARDGKEYQMSLVGTCLSSCHAEKAEFCDQCHQYRGVSPNCWDCHIAGEQ